MRSEQDIVEDLFEAALPLSHEERIVLLDRRCEGAPELRRAVQALIAVNEQAGNFLDEPLLPERFLEATNIVGNDTSTGIESRFYVGQIVVERFTILRFVARGGMGQVWEAWDSQVQERVALKSIHPRLAGNPDVRERFRREVKEARAISHPNVCRIHELFSFRAAPGNTVLFLCMEFLEGPTLSDYLRHNGPFDPSAAYKLVEQLVDGLQCAHSLGVVHRDLKAKNIMLVNTGLGKMRAVITDFGLALNVLSPEGGLRELGGQGTADYMAPEQKLLGNVTALADQYALGVVMCEMLTGSRPVPTENAALRKPRNVKLPDKPLPVQWANVIQRSLATRPEDRFEHLDEILSTLRPPQRRWLLWAACLTAACLVLGAAGWILHNRPAATASLAVLPIHNASRDNTLDYLGAGLTEALTNDLAVMPGLQVKAATISERYPAQSADPGESGKHLNVGSVVSGSFFEAGGHVRIPIEIIDVRSGSQIWGKTYEGDLSRLAELQNEISTDVAYQLKVRLNPDLTARLKRQYATVPAAYNAYLKGRYSLNQRSLEELRSAVTDFQSALDADPHYAPAYAGLADSYALLGHYGSAHESPMMNKALTAANQALALDPTLGEAYASRAMARTVLDYEWKQAESDYLRALELNPNYMNAHIWYALLLLSPLGRDTEANGQLSYAQAANPNSMLTYISSAMVAKCARREAESAQILEAHFDKIQHFEPAIGQLAMDYVALKRPLDAISLLQRTRLEPVEATQRAIYLSIAYASAGNFPDAKKSFNFATKGEARENSFPYNTAVYYTLLNKRAQAIDALEYAYTQRDSDLLTVNVDPLLEPLHSAPRFKNLLRKMNLE